MCVYVCVYMCLITNHFFLSQDCYANLEKNCKIESSLSLGCSSLCIRLDGHFAKKFRSCISFLTSRTNTYNHDQSHHQTYSSFYQVNRFLKFFSYFFHFYYLLFCELFNSNLNFLCFSVKCFNCYCSFSFFLCSYFS